MQLKQVGPDICLTHHTKSPLKWVGGKAWAVEKIGPILLDHLERTGGAYVEPFLGGGSMALYIGANYPKPLLLGDVVEPLVEFWQAIQRNAGELAYTVARIGLEYGLDEKGYYAVREAEPDEALHRAARFLYLNRLCWNGLWRENAAGKMNSPAGSRAKEGKATLPERSIYTDAGKALLRAQIRLSDFETLIDEAGERDLVYADCPYHAVTQKDKAAAFTDYAKGGFGVQDQERLAMALYRASERGATFVAHNSFDSGAPTTAEVGVQYWYGEFAEVIPVKEPRRVSSDGNRDDAACALITNSKKLAEKLQ